MNNIQSTHVRCGLFNDNFTVNLLLSLQVKELRNQTFFGKVKGKKMMSSFLWNTVYMCICSIMCCLSALLLIFCAVYSG